MKVTRSYWCVRYMNMLHKLQVFLIIVVATTINIPIPPLHTQMYESMNVLQIHVCICGDSLNVK